MKPSATLRALLIGAIDYAGLFPPAHLSMQDAVDRYSEYLQSPYAWALGRFVVQASRLEELLTARRTAGGVQRSWALSALLGANSVAECDLIRDFNSVAEGLAHVDSVETKGRDAGGGVSQLTEIMKALPSSIRVFCELPLGPDTRELVRAIRDTNAFAKVRTGGVTPDAFPGTANLAEFILTCADVGLPFKATAGLHHPCRGSYPLTYDAGAATGTMFGFVNVFVAATLAQTEFKSNRIVELLEAGECDRFCFDDDGLTWRDVRVSRERIEHSRREFVLSFGSCSFEEPIEDLRALSLL